MSQYQFTPEALSDLFELWSYIAADNVNAADRVEAAAHAACALAAEKPLAGQVREDLTALPVRFGWCSRIGIAGLCMSRRRLRCKSFVFYIQRETSAEF